MLITGNSFALSFTYLVFGTSISMPNSITCAVIIKMMSSTSMTSTKGVTLISESAGDPWNRRRPDDPPPLLTVIAIGSLSVRAFGHVEELEGEVVQPGADLLDRVAKLVVSNGRGDGRQQAEGGRDQRFRYSRTHRAQARAALRPELLEGADDAQHGAKQPDEGADRCRRGQPAHVAFQLGQLFARSQLQGALERD